jgi:hypothetical protein
MECEVVAHDCRWLDGCNCRRVNGVQGDEQGLAGPGRAGQHPALSRTH